MFLQKRWNFGLGTVFSLIVIYFIFLYSRSKGWALLAFISKWYLFIVGGLIALSVGTVLIIIVFSLLLLLIASLKMRSLGKTFKKSKKKKPERQKEYFDAEYELKE